ncbi:reverse transcriptase domain-containing protein [Tanacetum coccineum]
MAPKRTSTSAAPAMTQAVIGQLVADSVVAALKVFIGGLPHSIKGTVTASKPQTLEEAITITQRLMDQVTKHNSVQGTNDHKRKFDDRRTFNNNNYQNNHNNRNNDYQQQQSRRQETFRACAATPTKNKGYTRNLPLCKRCTLHHTEPCTIRCQTCNKVGHLTRNCRSKGPATRSNLQPVSVTCHACGEKGHYKYQCPKANNNAHGKAYLMRDKNAHQDPNVVTGTFLLNQHLARVLFDSGADKSFVSISLASMLNIPPITIDTFYDIEMADGNQHILDQKELNMRQSHWLELLADYDCEIRYHPRKANVVVDALSQKEQIKSLRVRSLVMTLHPKDKQKGDDTTLVVDDSNILPGKWTSSAPRSCQLPRPDGTHDLLLRRCRMASWDSNLVDSFIDHI